jgi:linoleoyl-CoA desaturase
MLSADYRALRKELHALYGTPDTARQVAQFGFHVAMNLGGAALYFAAPEGAAGGWLACAGALASSLGCLGISTNAHTASHDAIFRGRAANQALVHAGFPFLLMVSANYWNHKHLVVHHPVPNVIGLDDDIDLAPVFAFSEDEYARARGWQRLLFRWQWLIFPFALALNGLNAQRQGAVFLYRKLRSSRRKPRHFVDLGLLLAHVAVFWALPMAFLPAGEVLLFHLARMVLLGYAMFAAFGAAHFPEEAVAVDKRLAKSDYVLLQTATTVNFTTGPFGRLLCSGVDFQIEHHLFPEFSHTHYPKMAPRMQAFCREHGYPYRTLGWGEAVWKSLAAMARPRPVLRSVEELRTGATGQATGRGESSSG